MKTLYNSLGKKVLSLLVVLGLSFSVLAQEETEEKKKKSKPVRSPFESSLLIDNQTIVVPQKGTMQFDIHHRFGTLQNGSSDFFGMWAPSNIRLGIQYSIFDDVSVGIGTTKFNKLVDLNVKYNFLKQTRDWSMPVGVTFYGSAAIDTRGAGEYVFEKDLHRVSYFATFIVGVKINKKLSMQLSPSMSHFNAVDSLYKNDIFAVTYDGRYKISSTTSILFQLSQPMNTHDLVDSDGNSLDLPKPNLALGIEMSTSSHAFQVFLANYQAIQYQNSIANNRNDFSNGWEGFLIGFNITRLWNF